MVRYDKVSKKRLVSNAGTVHNTNSTFIPKAKNGYDLSDRGAVKDIFILYFYLFSCVTQTTKWTKFRDVCSSWVANRAAVFAI